MKNQPKKGGSGFAVLRGMGAGEKIQYKFVLLSFFVFLLFPSYAIAADHESPSPVVVTLSPKDEFLSQANLKLKKQYEAWVKDASDSKNLSKLLLSARDLEPIPRTALLYALQGTSLKSEQLKDFFLDFSKKDSLTANSQEMVEFLFACYEEARLRGVLDQELLRYLGYLFAGDSFDPESKGFARIARRKYERIRDEANAAERTALDAGMRDRFSERLGKAGSSTPRDAVNKLVQVKNIWGDKRYSDSADFLIGKQFVGQWDFAVKNLGLLFLMKAKEVSPEARELSSQMVKHWLDHLEKPTPKARTSNGMEAMKHALSEAGHPELFKQIEESASLSANQHKDGIIDSPTVIFGQQYRNLVLKEVLQTYPLTEKQRKLVNEQLEKNEKELTGQLAQFEKGETTTDEITGYNTYTLVTTILTAKDPDRALTVIREKAAAPFAPYLIYSNYKATPRAGAARTVPYRLAELAHENDPEKQKLLKRRLADAVTNFMNFLPDLMYHARGNYMHRGDDQLAPYFFHPAVPFQAASLRILANDPNFSEGERKEFNEMRALLAKALLASQKKDGTFSLPDQVGDGDGGYYSSPIWVNPLAGLALLSLVDDAKEPSTQLGILNPEVFRKKTKGE